MQAFILLTVIGGLSNVLQSSAFLGFTKQGSLLFYEPWSPIAYDRNNDVTEAFLTQRLDNFDPQNNRTFQMRYLKNEKYAKPNGPIFLYLGGEWKISEGFLLNSHVRDMAQEMNGLIVYTEHRFYGNTRPTETLDTENLRYLSVDQALADVAHFIRETKKESKYSNSSVIVIGASYSATMAIWFRQKYPHLAVGAWASSAPVQAQLDFKEYAEVVAQSLALIGGDQCLDAIQGGFALTEELIQKEQYQKLRELYNLCDDFDPSDKFNVWSFVADISDLIAGYVQGHRPGKIESACEQIKPSNSSDTLLLLNSFSTFVKKNLLGSQEKCANASYADTVKHMKKTEYKSAARQWFYQTCSEFGWYQTSSSKNQPFGTSFPIELSTRLCRDVFGENFTKYDLNRNIERKNNLYGGMNPAVTNVIFTHGQLDPWRTAGVQTDLNKHSPAIVIPRVSHCNDLSPIDLKNDSKDMIYAKIAIRNSIKAWIGWPNIKTTSNR